MIDKTGYPIPESVKGLWCRADEKGREWLAKLDQVIERVSEGIRSKDVIFAELDEGVISDLRLARQSLERVTPYAVCPSCSGQQREKCVLCKQRGFISEFAWNTYVPIETRELRGRIVGQTLSAYPTPTHKS